MTRSPLRTLIILPLIVLGVAGCTGPLDPADHSALQPAGIQASIVVALVDIGINPYHEAFRAPGVLPPASILGGATPVSLTFAGAYRENLEADAAFWSQVERGRLYWFQDTRVLAISIQDPTLDDIILESIHHGTATAAAVLDRAPDTWIVMVQTGSARTNLPPFFDATYASEAIRWSSQQPFIDLISLSIGSPASLPFDGYSTVPASTLEATRAGKVVVVGTGNDGLPGITSQLAGPPWVVRAGGVDPAQSGETALASRAPDYVSDYVGMLACSDSVTESCEFMGTSLSTPLIAGAYAQAILDLRRAADHAGGITDDGALVEGNGLRFTNHDLRAAFNDTATYWATTDYTPQAPPLDGDPLLIPFRVAAPVLPTPWVQMGWGYVGNDTGPLVAQGLLDGRLPGKAPEAVAYMRLAMQAREAYWDQQD